MTPSGRVYSIGSALRRGVYGCLTRQQLTIVYWWLATGQERGEA